MIVKVNLLDWRSGRRDKNKKEFFRMLALFGACAALIVGFTYFVMSERITSQQGRNTLLKNEITKVDKQIAEIKELEDTKANLLSRMHVIEQLQQSRSATVHFFDEIVNTMPDGTYLTGIKQTGQSVVIDGIAESNGNIATYLRNLDSSPWFSDPSLVVIKTEDKGSNGNITNINLDHKNSFTIKVNNLTKQTDKKTDKTDKDAKSDTDTNKADSKTDVDAKPVAVSPASTSVVPSVIPAVPTAGNKLSDKPAISVNPDNKTDNNANVQQNLPSSIGNDKTNITNPKPTVIPTNPVSVSSMPASGLKKPENTEDTNNNKGSNP